VKLNAKWEALAAKEVKGKDLKETLVHETNEQMLTKPLYTSEDWQPSKEVEVPGKLLNGLNLNPMSLKYCNMCIFPLLITHSS
jgi:hypothetical protein